MIVVIGSTYAQIMWAKQRCNYPRDQIHWITITCGLSQVLGVRPTEIVLLHPFLESGSFMRRERNRILYWVQMCEACGAKVHNHKT